MSDQFKGFPVELFTFLKDLRRHNNREWFHANKVSYEQYVAEPMADFISAMVPRLARINDHYVADPRRRGGSMFRIQRDMRFSKDKRPYKENVGCQFRHEAGRGVHAPGFYIHIEPEQVFFGGGIWQPDSESLHSIRNAISEHGMDWNRITRNKVFIQRFSGIEGDQLQRPPRGIAPDHPHIKDLKRKSFFAMQKVEPELLLTPQFIEEVSAAFTDLNPLMRFLTRALDLSTTETI